LPAGAIIYTEGYPASTKPKHVMSFAKVGNGFKEKDLEALRGKLDDHMVKAGKSFKPPSCYKVTGAAAETPDVWISHPEESVVVTVKGDIRLVRTTTFRSPYSLRFPRVTSVCWTKPYYEVMSDRGLIELVDREGGIAVDTAGSAWERGGDNNVLHSPSVVAIQVL
jgi:DNA ligase-4